jgi:hypothetical protein
MAERKPSVSRAPKRPELERLIQRSKEAGVSDEVLEEQQASFVYGNAPRGSRITKESARRASKSLRLVHR